MRTNGLKHTIGDSICFCSLFVICFYSLSFSLFHSILLFPRSRSETMLNIDIGEMVFFVDLIVVDIDDMCVGYGVYYIYWLYFLGNFILFLYCRCCCPVKLQKWWLRFCRAAYSTHSISFLFHFFLVSFIFLYDYYCFHLICTLQYTYTLYSVCVYEYWAIITVLNIKCTETAKMYTLFLLSLIFFTFFSSFILQFVFTCKKTAYV